MLSTYLPTLLTGAGAGAFFAASFGVLPRIGPGRAVALAMKSLTARVLSPHSVRTSDVAILKQKLGNLGGYIVVKGPKGVGKSTVIATALQNTCGVVVVEVFPGQTADVIKRSVLESIAGTHPNFVDPHPSALRVLWWYRLVLPPPIVVLRLVECSAGTPYAQMTGAVRSLADIGLRAVIDSSPNSLEPEALASLRENVLEVAPMPRALLFSIPEHAALFETLRKEGLQDVVWGVLGGVPALYSRLAEALAEAKPKGLVVVDEPGAACTVVTNFVRGQLLRAINRLWTLDPKSPLRDIFALFKGMDEVPAKMLRGIAMPSPNKVLREVNKGVETTVYVPADAAMALLLRHGFESPPSIDVLRTLCTPTAAADGEKDAGLAFSSPPPP